MLLKQTRESKLSPIYKPDPYVVTHKDENAVVLEDKNGNSKMRHVAHMKTFVDPATIKVKKSKPPQQLEVRNQTVNPVQCNQPEPTAIQPCI